MEYDSDNESQYDSDNESQYDSDNESPEFPDDSLQNYCKNTKYNEEDGEDGLESFIDLAKAYIDSFIETGGDVNGQINGFTPLFVACREGNFEIADLLISYYGADPDLQNDDGMTCLYAASFNGFYSIAAMLLHYEADIDQQQDDGSSPLWVAICEGHTNIVDLFLNEGAQIHDHNNETMLFIAACEGHNDIVSRLLDNEGVDPNVGELTHNISPLMIASRYNHMDVVETLLNTTNIDVNAVSSVDYTALQIAEEEEHWAVADLLIQYGAVNPDQS